MSNNNFSLHFVIKQESFDIGFEEPTKSSEDAVSINGRQYVLKGNSADIEWLKKTIPELEKHQNLSSEDLQKRLVNSGAQDISTTSKTDSVAKQQLTPNQKQQLSLEKTINFASSLFNIDKESIQKTLNEETNQTKIKEAFTTPTPVCSPPDEPIPTEDDRSPDPPMLKEMTNRERVVLGTIATILGKNAELENACIKDFHELVLSHSKGKIVQIEGNRNVHYVSHSR